MVASSCSSANPLLPMDTLAPLPLLPEPAGQLAATPLLLDDDAAPPVLPPPQPASAAIHTVSRIAMPIRFTVGLL
jgi:hypothetical protein